MDFVSEPSLLVVNSPPSLPRKAWMTVMLVSRRSAGSRSRSKLPTRQKCQKQFQTPVSNTCLKRVFEIQGSAQATRAPFVELENSGNKASMFMKTKEEIKKSWAGADVAIERLRCAEGAGRSECGPRSVPPEHRRVEKPLSDRHRRRGFKHLDAVTEVAELPDHSGGTPLL